MKKSARLILILGTVITIVFAFANPSNECDKFKNGRFKFHPKDAPTGYFFTIQRNDSLQLESDNAGHLAKYFIKWTEQCKYELKLFETSFPLSDEQKQRSKTIPMKSEILSWTNDYYIFKAEREGSNLIMVDTIWIEK